MVVFGADAEIKTNAKGSEYLQLSVATDSYDNGERKTTWVSVLFGGERATKVKDYLTKGRLISVKGVENYHLYKNRNGETVLAREVFADRIEFVHVSNKTQNTEQTQTEAAPNVSCDPFAEPSKPTNEASKPAKKVVEQKTFPPKVDNTSGEPIAEPAMAYAPSGVPSAPAVDEEDDLPF